MIRKNGLLRFLEAVAERSLSSSCELRASRNKGSGRSMRSAWENVEETKRWRFYEVTMSRMESESRKDEACELRIRTGTDQSKLQVLGSDEWRLRAGTSSLEECCVFALSCSNE